MPGGSLEDSFGDEKDVSADPFAATFASNAIAFAKNNYVSRTMKLATKVERMLCCLGRLNKDRVELTAHLDEVALVQTGMDMFGGFLPPTVALVKFVRSVDAELDGIAESRKFKLVRSNALAHFIDILLDLKSHMVQAPGPLVEVLFLLELAICFKV